MNMGELLDRAEGVHSCKKTFTVGVGRHRRWVAAHGLGTSPEGGIEGVG